MPADCGATIYSHAFPIQTCWITGLPRSNASGLPGKRVDPYRAGMRATTSSFDLLFDLFFNLLLRMKCVLPRKPLRSGFPSSAEGVVRFVSRNGTIREKGKIVK